jgi:NAD-dependent deacetylase
MGASLNAAELIANSSFTTAFTGAGISVESNIPPFRGPGGVWETYDPKVLEISFFQNNPEPSWKAIKEIFYGFFEKAKPNAGHKILANWEQEGFVKGIITQNIDNLHHEAGSKNVVEFHGNSRTLMCLSCGKHYNTREEIIARRIPSCSCGGILKPDFVFFGEGIPEEESNEAWKLVEKTDTLIIIGSTGEVFPAAMLPSYAREHGAKIIEINPSESQFTHTITDIFIQNTACEALAKIDTYLKK